MKSFEERCEESAMIRERNDMCIPIIVEKMAGEKFLPVSEKRRFSIMGEVPFHSLMCTVRKNLQLHAEQSFFMLIGGRHMACGTTTMESLYSEYKDEDGFLYITYASQETYG